MPPSPKVDESMEILVSLLGLYKARWSCQARLDFLNFFLLWCSPDPLALFLHYIRKRLSFANSPMRFTIPIIIISLLISNIRWRVGTLYQLKAMQAISFFSTIIYFFLKHQVEILHKSLLFLRIHRIWINCHGLGLGSRVHCWYPLKPL